jgi:hypothetical protein
VTETSIPKLDPSRLGALARLLLAIAKRRLAKQAAAPIVRG